MTTAFNAAAAGNCTPIQNWGQSVQYTGPCTPGKPTTALANFKVSGSAVYGTGAVIEYTDAEVTRPRHGLTVPGAVPTAGKAVAVFPLALSPTGSYVYAGGPSGTPIVAGPFIGTTPNGWSSADAIAVLYLKSIQSDDCNTWFKYSVTPAGMPKQQACSLGLKQADARLHQLLASGQPTKLFHLGGNSFIYFYGVRIGSTAGTLVVARDQPPAPPFVAVATVRAP